MLLVVPVVAGVDIDKAFVVVVTKYLNTAYDSSKMK